MGTSGVLIAQAVVSSQTVFTTQVPSGQNFSDGTAYELGMKFQSTKNGQLGAIRYWKAAGESGTHVGKIWSTNGTLLASVTFANETASGWQEQALSTPVSIQSGTTYTVSVNVNSHYVSTIGELSTSIINGDLRSVADGSNGVYGSPNTFPTSSYQNSNYYRDIVFVASASLVKVSGDGQTATAGATLAQPFVVQAVDSAGTPRSGITVSFTVSGGGGSLSATSVVTDANGRASTTLTVGATGGVNTVTASASGYGSVTFQANGNAPRPAGQNIFTTQTPSNLGTGDGRAYELGAKFQSAKGGQVTGVRYWKATNETGTHVGRIWSANGTLLASVTFANETASGWQEQILASPVSIQPNTTYVVSVNSNVRYAATAGELATAIANGDLRTVADGKNGVYGSPNVFPTSSYQNTNYYRDVFFQPGASLRQVSGNNQYGSVGSALPNALVVQAVDEAGNPRSGVTVNFAVVSGGGSVSPSSVITDGSGLASTTLTLGLIAGKNVVSATATGFGTVSFQAGSYTGQPNLIILENQQPGTRDWMITSLAFNQIEGYASTTSVPKGGTLPIKVSLSQPGQFRIDVYRIGFYSGQGGRLMASSGVLNGTTQPAGVVTDPITRLYECNWATSYTLAVSTNWTSGLYVAKLTELQTGTQSRVWFIVRDDNSQADIVFQSAFNTVLAYNPYATIGLGHSLYSANSSSGQRAFKVSFDRPLREATTVDGFNAANPIRWEYNMIRWLESQGYDVTYISDVDFQTNSQVLLNNQVFLSVGHDEYWTTEKRNIVEQARAAGVHLGFFSANTCYWHVRFENSSTGAPNRVMVCYKTDPDPIEQQNPAAATYKFRSPQVNRPENALLGVMYTGDTSSVYGGFDFIVSNASDRYYANTGLANGDRLSGLVGYEWDAVVDGPTPSGVVLTSPSGLVTLSSSPVPVPAVLPTYDEPVGQETLPAGYPFNISNAVRYGASGGSKVFSTGSIHWSWGLDSDGVNPPREDIRVKQITVNVLADMGVKPVTPDFTIIVP